MNLTELCSLMPKISIEGSDAVIMMVESLKTAEKVHKSQLYFAQNQEQNELIIKAIDQELKNVDASTLLWRGSYATDDKNYVRFWFFMHGFIVIQGKDGYFSFSGKRMTKTQWKKLAQTEVSG